MKYTNQYLPRSERTPEKLYNLKPMHIEYIIKNKINETYTKPQPPNNHSLESIIHKKETIENIKYTIADLLKGETISWK
ncbi:MAG: hypothetical protein ACOCP4_02125 [Candidatus Woesearchaeota archaeon]